MVLLNSKNKPVTATQIINLSGYIVDVGDSFGIQAYYTGSCVWQNNETSKEIIYRSTKTPVIKSVEECMDYVQGIQLPKKKRKFRLIGVAGSIVAEGHIYNEGNVQLDWHADMPGSGQIQFSSVAQLLTEKVWRLEFLEG